MRGRREYMRPSLKQHRRHFAGGGGLEFKGQNTAADFTKAEADAYQKAFEDLQLAQRNPAEYARQHGLTLSEATRDIERRNNELSQQAYNNLRTIKPEDTEYGHMQKQEQEAAAQNAYENRWKGKLGGGSTPEEKADSLRAYQESL